MNEGTKSMEFRFPDAQENKFLSKKKGKPSAKTKSRNASGKRAHHNALEQQRRGVIRGCFESLRKSVPTLASGDKKLSRSGILRETAKYIKMTKEKIAEYMDDLEELRLQNQLLSGEIGYLGCLHDMTPLLDDLNSFGTKNAMEGEKIEGNQTEEYHTNSIMSNSFPLHTKDLKNSFPSVYTGIRMEKDLLGSTEYLKIDTLEGKISTDEEYDVDVDVEGFVQTPFSIMATCDS